MSPPFVCAFSDSAALGWNNKQALACLVHSLKPRMCLEELPCLKVVTCPTAVCPNFSAFWDRWECFQNFPNENCGLQIYLQFFPCDATNDAAFFYVLLADCICQNFMIVCDRGVQITKAFPVTQEQLNSDHPRLEVKICCKELTLLIDHYLNLNGVLVKVWKSCAPETLKSLTVANDSCYLQLDNFSVCNIQGISCSTNDTENLETAISVYLG